MKTPDEFKKALECRIRACRGTCAYECGSCDVYVDRPFSTIFADGIRYIQQLEANWQQVSKALCDKENATLEEVLQAANQVKCGYSIPARSGKSLALMQSHRIAELEQELAAVKRERDATVAIYVPKNCNTCKHKRVPSIKEPCNTCIMVGDGELSGWEWRGVSQENMEVQE